MSSRCAQSSESSVERDPECENRLGSEARPTLHPQQHTATAHWHPQRSIRGSDVGSAGLGCRCEGYAEDWQQQEEGRLGGRLLILRLEPGAAAAVVAPPTDTKLHEADEGGLWATLVIARLEPNRVFCAGQRLYASGTGTVSPGQGTRTDKNRIHSKVPEIQSKARYVSEERLASKEMAAGSKMGGGGKD
ncbi:hypothetical protein GSI_05661 [Ganoderma sinense ZZ0214-1]|uniref:Uncharacterized protein n=1 Tax=Ganoderma sinense ZZ0214-1 TaxID=1077348 RepID=A0A2G8SF57_9APHY|nr:hypothetical protein GSI_05661 [Ganoderma sinense ZZ0214-1]